MNAITSNIDRWFGTFERIPVERCAELLECGDRALHEITLEMVGDKVRFWNCKAVGELTYIDRDNGEYEVEFDDGETVTEDYHFDVVRDTALPDCDELYAFTNIADENWYDDGGCEIMADLGFRVYESESYGTKWTYAFGIDGGLTDELLDKLYSERMKISTTTKKSA